LRETLGEENLIDETPKGVYFDYRNAKVLISGSRKGALQ